MLPGLFWPVELGLCLPLGLLLLLGHLMGRWMRSPDFRLLYPGCRGGLLRLVYGGLVAVGAGTLLALLFLLLAVQMGWSLPDSTLLEMAGTLLVALLHLGLSRLASPPPLPRPTRPISHGRTRR